MRYEKFILSILILLCFGLTGLNAQVAVPAAGGVASGSGGSVTYTVGQIVYTTNAGTAGTLEKGVQHSYEISVVPGLQDDDGMRLICFVYPNPTSDIVKLQIENRIENLTYYLYDMNGKLILKNKIESKETIISMGNLIPATYFLKVVQTIPDSLIQKIKTFKIIKKN